MKNVFLVLVLGTLCGCVSIGAQCANSKVNAWVKVKRFGVGVPAKQVDNVARFKQLVCDGY